jgi:L-amino acid N-acyltransferase YncA
VAGPLILRAASAGDAASIAAIYAPYVRDSIVTFESDPPDAATMAARIAEGLDNQFPWIVATDPGGDIAGYAYAARFHARAAYRFTIEPTVYVARGRHGAGIGTALYEALLGIVTQQGFCEAIALVALPNAASVALHERHGFHRSGTYERSGHKLGRWIDVGLFQKSLAAQGTEPSEPRALGDSAIWSDLASLPRR